MRIFSLIKRISLLPLAASILVAGSGCSPGIRDAERVANAVENLKSGAVVRAVEAAIQESKQAEREGAPQPQAPVPAPAPMPVLGEVAPELPATCRDLPAIDSDATEAEAEGALQELMSCFRELLAPGKRVSELVKYLRYFQITSVASFSLLSAEEIDHFLLSRKARLSEWMDVRLGLSEPFHGDRLRSSFSDSELNDFALLLDRRTSELLSAEAKIIGLSLIHRKLLERFAEDMDRYAVLLALVDFREDREGANTARAIDLAMRKRSVIEDEILPFLHPYALTVVIPERGREFSSLHRTRENPFSAVRVAMSDLGGGGGRARALIAQYAKLRDQDNPDLPANPEPARDAVRVAFIDTGLDFIQFPELGVYLGKSRDFSDEDRNPWLPAMRPDFAHGSATATTLLSVISWTAPSILRERRLDLQFWKVQSLRQLLGGRSYDLLSWESRMGAQNALRWDANNIAGDELPRIVSASLSAQLHGVLDRSADPLVVSRAPWLWVMAAGNSSSSVELDSSAPCFSDLPAKWRDDSRILCVGALSRGQEGGDDRIAGYSNFGERVDVYAYESYVGMCPEGTSCATPAITAAVTMLAAEYPALTSAQLKQAIVSAAQRRELQVDRKDRAVTRKIRVFDPETMMKRAREAAQLLIAVPETETR